MDAGPRIEVPSARSSTEAGRTTTAVKLRLRAEDARACERRRANPASTSASTQRATTSYRSQGRTVDSIFALASSAEAQRELYVDVTRAREDVTIAYGKDEVRDVGELLVRAQRDEGKVLVRDVERVVSVRVEREQQREREQKRLGSVAIEQEQVPKIDRGHDQNRDRGMGR